MEKLTDTDDLPFSEKVKWVRGQLLLTQAEFAAEIGVTPATVSRWENSDRKPSFLCEKQFEKFCKEHSIEL